MKLGDRLREIRQQHDETLAQVAHAVEISVSYLSDLERGRTRPSLATLEQLAGHHQLSPANFVAPVDGWGEHTLAALPPGLAELVKDGTIPEAYASDLSRIELGGLRPQEREEWLELYLHLKRIMPPYLGALDPAGNDG